MSEDKDKAEENTVFIMPTAPKGLHFKVGKHEGLWKTKYHRETAFGVSLKRGPFRVARSSTVNYFSDEAIFEAATALANSYTAVYEKKRRLKARLKAVSGNYPPKTRIGA